MFYEEESEYYCTDFCDPDRCPEGEVCTLETVQCVRAPCPPLATCLDDDPCSGTCAETQVGKITAAPRAPLDARWRTRMYYSTCTYLVIVFIRKMYLLRVLHCGRG